MSNVTKSTKNRSQKSLIDSIVTNLVRLDKALAPKKTSATVADNNISVKQLREMYRDFIERFMEIGELETSVLVHSVALAKKVVKIAKSDYTFKKGEFVLLYSACLYLSIKMLIDEERWFLADFSYVSNLEEAHIEKMEQFVLIDILNFDPKISEEVYKKERHNLLTASVPKKRLTVM
jgi:hypothetical protein